MAPTAPMAPMALTAPVALLALLALLAPKHYPDSRARTSRSRSGTSPDRSEYGATNHRGRRAAAARSAATVSSPLRQAAERPDRAGTRSTGEVSRRLAVVWRDPVDASWNVGIVPGHTR